MCPAVRSYSGSGCASQGQQAIAGTLAFWMANASELLNFLKHDNDLSPLTRQSQLDLSHLVHSAYRYAGRTPHKPSAALSDPAEDAGGACTSAQHLFSRSDPKTLDINAFGFLQLSGAVSAERAEESPAHVPGRSRAAWLTATWRR